MIASLKGQILDKEDGFVILHVAGIGYKVFTTEKVRAKCVVGNEIMLWTYLAVRDDAWTLYGFEEKTDISLFESLLSVSGIGPKSALSILNTAASDALRSAIASGDASHLAKTTGLGLKKAEKIVLELKDKFDFIDGSLENHKEISDVIDALVALGYSRKESQDVIKRIPVSATTAETKIKEALKILGK